LVGIAYRFNVSSHVISFNFNDSYGWYSSYDDLNLLAYNSYFGWSLLYSYNAIPTKPRLFASESIFAIMDKVFELTGKQMRFRDTNQYSHSELSHL